VADEAMASSVHSAEGPRMRLNINALVNDEVVGKFLIVVAEEAGMDVLVDKVNKTLRRGGIHSTVERVCNSLKAVLPHDEFVGDMMRDGEEVFVMLRGQDGERMDKAPLARGQADSGGGPPMGAHHSATGVHSQPVSASAVAGHSHNGIMPMRVMLTAPQFDGGDDDSESDQEIVAAHPTVAPYPPPPAHIKGQMGSTQHVPGPSENFEYEKYAYDLVQVDHPCDPIQPTTYDNDWLVESLTPQLRNHVLDNFHEELITEPKYVSSIGKFVGPRFYQASGSFISIFMRPQTAVGSDPCNTMPVHYNIAKHDLMTFQRKAETHIDKAQQHISLFAATMRGLQALLQKGMSETDHISEMLPHSYQAMDEVEGAMMEVDRPLFPTVDGSNPCFIIDTSGAVGEHLVFVKAALKRMLFAHMSDKASFQLIRFQASGGEPRLWMQGMVRPTDDAICAAEAWVENLAPVSSARLVNGLRYAVSHQDCDSIYVISAGTSDQSQHDQMLMSIRQLNTREVRINTVGVEPTHLGELLLRNLAESNHGDIVLKSFKGTNLPAYSSDDQKWTSWRTNLVNEKSKQLSDSFKKPKMSIGSQVRIIEVMQREEKQKEEFWREEWNCTQRLLISAETSKKNGTVMGDRDMVKELERKAGRTQLARVGGGFMYRTEELDLGLERLFEHQSAVPWTANSDTAAAGPKVPMGGAGQGRVARFPPARDMLPEAILPMPERRARPRSAGVGQGFRKVGGAGPLSAPGNPWVASSPSTRTRKLPSLPSGAGYSGGGLGSARGGGGRAPSPGGRAPSPGGRAASPFSARAPSPARGGAGPRQASADRAGGGDRQASPRNAAAARKGRGRTPSSTSRDRPPVTKAYTSTGFTNFPAPPATLPPLAAATMPEQQESLQHPRLERRWSF